MKAVKLGQLWAWKDDLTKPCIIVRMGPDNSEKNFELFNNEAELMYPHRPNDRHKRMIETILRDYQLICDVK